MEEHRMKARQAAALSKLLHEHGTTFAEKVAYVREHMPNVTDPEAFVAAALRKAGELK